MLPEGLKLPTGRQSAKPPCSRLLPSRETPGAVLLVFLIAFVCCDRDSGDPQQPQSPPVSPKATTAPTPPADDPLRRVAIDPLGDHVSNRYPASLATVVEKRYLRVLTSRNAFDFFVHQGHRGGYQFEMVEAFTRFLNERHVAGGGALEIQFELLPVPDDRMIPLLREGAADLIAARLTITPERAEQLRFSRSYQTVDELVVTHDATAGVDSIEDLSGKAVAIRQGSSYHQSLLALDQEFRKAGRSPVQIEVLDGALATEKILQLVAARRYPYSVADSIVAERAIALHPQLRIVPGIALRRDGKLAWATQLPAKELEQEMNTFLARYKDQSLLGNLAIQKFFAADSELTRRLAEGGDSDLSPYDPLFKQYAAEFLLDWRLVAAMAHQESRFNPAARNASGAVGLMQIKPDTAREPYVDIPDIEGVEHASNNIEAGLKYLNWIKQRYFDSNADMRERDRLRMALAAYNAGPRTILRAQRHAPKLGLDPNRWFRNVELALLDLRKSEPVRYVSEINQRYLAYVLLGIE